MKARPDTRPPASLPPALQESFRVTAGLWGPAAFADVWATGVARFAELQAAMLTAKSPYEAWMCQANWWLETTTQAMGFWTKLIESAVKANPGLYSPAPAAAHEKGTAPGESATRAAARAA